MKRAGTPPRLFLLELGTEEIPARMIDGALRDLALALRESLAGTLAPASGLTIGEGVRTMGTPRRLAVIVAGLLDREPDSEVESIGPAVKVAFDAAGRATRAAEGFARAQGVAVSDLLRVDTPKGECVGLRRRVPGRPALQVLAHTVPAVVGGLTFPKMMRWGQGVDRFVRPIHTVVALFGEEVVPMVIAGVSSGRLTRGHRQRGGAMITIADAADYVDRLRDQGILADVAERRTRIERELAAQAKAAGGRIAAPPVSGSAAGTGDPELLDEVTHLVEWPTVITGSFDAASLELPAEVLVTSMRHHQKYFALRAASGTLVNRFLSVADVPADRRGAIRRGNEWVLRARLADARFFYDEDRRVPLQDRKADLARVTFHEKLGSYSAKSERIARLVTMLAPAFAPPGAAADDAQLSHAAELCKCDLTTQMVKEFPELQGIVGGLYARADGLPESVASAIYDHYLPRGADDPLPRTPEGRILALADRLDSQAGIFLLGLLPTGSRDPYALRRSVQGSCRIIIESGVSLSLRACLDGALRGYAPVAAPDWSSFDQALSSLLEFYAGRLQHLGEEAGLRQDSVRAALGAGYDDPRQLFRRMRALDAMRDHVDFAALVGAHKRIRNIATTEVVSDVRPDHLRDEAERVLHRQMEAARASIDARLARGEVLEALQELGALRPALDRFFDEVMVMADERALRENRLAMMQALAALFLRFGDFSEVVVEGAPPTAPRRSAGTGREA